MNIMITGAGGAATPALINFYRNKPEHNLIFVDMNINPYLNGLDAIKEQIPSADSPDFLSAINEIVNKYNIEAIIPGVDEEIIPLLNNYSGSDKPYIMSPDKETVKLTLDKLKLNKLLEKNNINVPFSWHINESENINKNYLGRHLIAKPISGRGSKGIYFSDSTEEAENLINYLKLRQPDTMFQEVISGVEYTVSMLCSKKGEILGIVPKKIISKKGITIDAITEKNDIIDQYCREIQNVLSAKGPLNIQLILDEENNPYVFEINPRISTTTILTMESGFDEINISINDYFGKDTKKTDWKEGIGIYRAWNNYFYSLNKN